MSSRAECVGCTQEKCVKSPLPTSLLTAIDSCLVFGGLDHLSLKKQDILVIQQFLNLRNRSLSSVWNNHITATTAWHLLLMLCCGMASHSSTSICCNLSQLKSPNLVVLVTLERTSHRTAGRPFHPLYSKFWRSPISQSVEIWDCHWLQNLISICPCIEIASDNESRFSSEGDAGQHHHTASTRRRYSIGAAISTVFSTSSPHIELTIQMQ